MWKLLILLSAFALMSGCGGNRQTIEGNAVEDLPVSHPPKAEVRVEKPVAYYDHNGIRLADNELRIYGAVVPLGGKIIAKDESKTVVTVPSMRYSQVKAFIEKYFPYQPYTYYRPVDLFVIEAKIKPEFGDDKVVLDLNANVLRPDRPIALRVAYNKRTFEYEWSYEDPDAEKKLDPDINMIQFKGK